MKINRGELETMDFSDVSDGTRLDFLHVPEPYRSLPYPQNFEKALDDGFPMDMDGETFMKARAEGFDFHLCCPKCRNELCMQEYVFFKCCPECIVKND